MEDDFDLDLLLSVASGLGRWQDVEGSSSRQVYAKDADCLACLKDLQRFLRRDDPGERPAFLKLGELQVVENDVIPLILTSPTDTDLVYNALKVLTFMTMPLDLATVSDLLPKQLAIVASIKAAATNRDLLGALMGLAAGPVSRAARMSDDDHQVLQLLLTFVRNLATIPDAPRGGGAAGLGRPAAQEALVQLLFDESALELALLVAGHVQDRRFKDDAPLLMDLLAVVYEGLEVRDVLAASAEAVAAAAALQQRRDAAEARAVAAKQKTMAQQLLQAKSGLTTRFGRFRTSLVESHADAVSKTYVTSLDQRHNLAPLGVELETRVRPPRVRKLPPALLLAYQRYTNALLSGAYNVLMGVLLKELSKGLGLSSMLQEGDAAKWYDLAAWLTSYVRLGQEARYEQRQREKQQQRDQQKQQQQQQQGESGAAAAAAGPDAAAAAAAAGPAAAPAAAPEPPAFGGISASLCQEAFRLAHLHFLEQVDVSPRSPYKDWALLSATTGFLREGLGCLELATRSGGSSGDRDRRNAERLARGLLYDGSREEGLLPALSRRIKRFSARHEPRSAAGVVVEALHALLRLYDRLSARDGGTFRVKKAARHVERRPKAAPAAPAPEDAGADGAKQQQEQPEAGGGDTPAAGVAAASPQQQQQQQPGQQGDDGMATAAPADGVEPAAAAAAVGGAEPADEDAVAPAAAAAPAAPLDTAAEGTGSRSASPAAAATPAAKQASPAAADHTAPRNSGASAAAAGAAGAADDDEVQQQQQPAGGAQHQRQKHQPVLEALAQEEGAYSGSGDEDEEGGGQHARMQEVVLDLNRELRSHLAAPSVVHFYAWLLAGVPAGINSGALNHALCSFLWRLVLPQHLDMEPLLYQLSVLRLFHQLLSDASLRKNKDSKEVLLLATHVVRGLFSKLAPGGGGSSKEGAAAAAASGQGAGAAAASGQGAGAASGAGAAQHADEEAAVQDSGGAAAAEREARRRAAVSGMLCVDLLFWKHPHTCDQINREYSLRENDRFDAGGRGGSKGRRGGGDASLKAVLNPEGEQRLAAKFLPMCASRANFDLLCSQMGGRLKPTELRRELKRLGLRFGSLPDALRPQLLEMFQGHGESAAARAGERAAVNAVADAIAQQLPGGWSAKQVKKLLQEEGLVGGGGRGGARRKGGGSSSEDDDAGSDGWLAGGHVLPGLDVQRLEASYQQHILAEDYLEQIAADLAPSMPEGVPPATADVLATLRHHGIAGGGGGRQGGSKKGRGIVRRGGGGGGGGKAAGSGGGAAARRVSKALLQGLWQDHGGSAEGLNLIAMALGLPVKEVQQLLIKHDINTDSARQRGSGSSSSEDDDGLGLADAGMFDSEEEEEQDGASDGGGATRRVRARKGAAAAARRLPVSLDRLRQLYERHAPAAAAGGSGEAAAAAGDAEQQQQQEVWLDAIAQELPVPASSSQVLAWLQQGGIVPAAADAGGGGGARRRSSGAVLLADGGSTQQQQKKRQRAARALLDSDDDGDDGGGGGRDATQGAGGRKARLAAAAAVTGGGGGPAAAAGGGGSGRVPEPEPLRLLGCLQALQKAHEDSGRWMDAAGAVAWVLGKLDAAEAVWAAAARVAAAAGVAPAGGGAAADYALVPSGDGDMDFFCSDWSNEVLEAAGVRNDSDDFFKIPGSSTPSWRARVRAALQGALQQLGSDEAEAACEVVVQEAAAAREAAEGAAAAAAAAAAQLQQGAGFGGGGGKKKARSPAAAAAAAAKPGKKGRKGKQQQEEEAEDGDDEEQQQQGRPVKRRKQQQAAAGGSGRGRGKKAAAAAAAAADSSDDGGWSEDLSALLADDAAGDAAAPRGGQQQQQPQQGSDRKRRAAAGDRQSGQGRLKRGPAATAASGSDNGSSEDDDGRADTAPVPEQQQQPRGRGLLPLQGSEARWLLQHSEDVLQPSGGGSGGRAALQEIALQNQQQQQQKPAAGPPDGVMLLDDSDDDEGGGGGENAAAVAAGGGGLVSKGRGRVVLMDDDDD